MGRRTTEAVSVTGSDVGLNGATALIIAVTGLLGTGLAALGKIIKAAWDGRNGATAQEQLTLATLADRFNADNLALRERLDLTEKALADARSEVDKWRDKSRGLTDTVHHQGITIAELHEELLKVRARVWKLEGNDVGSS